MEFCDLVESEKGKEKLIARGYLLCLRRKVTRKTTGEVAYYWRCEDRSCKGSAVTVIQNGKHQIQKFGDHSHAAEAHRPEVARVKAAIKRRAAETNDKPLQIIQSAIPTMSQEAQPYLPKTASLKQTAKRVRREEYTEPSTLEELNVPQEFRETLSGEIFLVKNTDVISDKVLLFTTVSNLRKLSEAQFWIMDGTFKTVPTVFTQLYSIHAPVGPEDRNRILPLAYSLMSSKSMECYKTLFQDLNDYAAENGINLAPSVIISDFEQAAIRASGEEFSGTANAGCFFHLCQNIYRKVQTVGLSSKYATEEDFSLKVRQFAALAFLQPSEVIPAWIEMIQDFPPEADELVQWFDETYIRGRVRKVLRGQQIRSSPLFPPALWSVNARVELGIPRTQNSVEAWHRRLGELVGAAHVGVFKMIKEIKKEQQNTEGQIECIIRGEPRKKVKLDVKRREDRLVSIFSAKASYTTADFLRGIAHNLKF
jgi:hypothetical protein